MNICFVSYDYPDDRRSVFPFVKQLVDEMVRQGHICQVVAPYSISSNKRFSKFKEKQIVGNGSVTIFRPNYISLSNLRVFGKELTFEMQKLVINYALNHLEVKPDVVYGHFWQFGMAGFNFARKNDIPLFVASGESVIPVASSDFKNSDFLNYIKGVICVSSKNRKESIQKGLTTDDKCIIIPNAIDKNKFHLKNKVDCRTNLGIHSDDFVVVFVGAFIERKGVLRVSEALKILQDNSIKAIFIGSGEQTPDYNNIIFKGKLPHEQIATYLNAADVFVLPTRAEGCCNAIIEAMACGLPIISSNLPFNWDVLNDDNSIMINPDSIDEIASAINLLKNDMDRRDRMTIASLKTAETLTIDNRARLIVQYMKERC